MLSFYWLKLKPKSILIYSVFHYKTLESMCHFISFGKKVVSCRLNPNQKAHLKTLIEIPFYTFIFKTLFKNLWYDINSLFERLIFVFLFICKRNIRNRLVCMSSLKFFKKSFAMTTNIECSLIAP